MLVAYQWHNEVKYWVMTLVIDQLEKVSVGLDDALHAAVKLVFPCDDDQPGGFPYIIRIQVVVAEYFRYL
jgi:hypothetical protein